MSSSYRRRTRMDTVSWPALESSQNTTGERMARSFGPEVKYEYAQFRPDRPSMRSLIQQEEIKKVPPPQDLWILKHQKSGAFDLRTTYDVPHAYKQADFLHHFEGESAPTAEAFPHPDMRSTRFHRGWQRKRVENNKDEAEVAYSQVKEHRAIEHEKKRRDFLRAVDTKNDQHPLTTASYTGTDRPATMHKKFLGSGLCDESEKRGQMILRESSNRYFVPPPAGQFASSRQTKMMAEGLGLAHPKMSAVLGDGGGANGPQGAARVAARGGGGDLFTHSSLLPADFSTSVADIGNRNSSSPSSTQGSPHRPPPPPLVSCHRLGWKTPSAKAPTITAGCSGDQGSSKPGR